MFAFPAGRGYKWTELEVLYDTRELTLVKRSGKQVTFYVPNPMSNIRSASSKTKKVTRCKLVALILTKSIIRPLKKEVVKTSNKMLLFFVYEPGVATTISVPCSKSFDCSHLEPPP